MQKLLTARDVREYMVLGNPQGILAVTSAGEALWIQVETTASLEALDDLLQLADVGTEARRRVAQQQTLIASDFMQQAGLPATEAAALVLSSAPLVVAAVHGLSVPDELLPACPRVGS